MNIGATIKRYRHLKDLTQEQLAEYLNVSVSAVSQWESGKTMPDITMLVPLANFFDITVDELLGRTAEKNTEIEEYKRRAQGFAHDGKIPEQISLWREAVGKYPGDFTCIYELAHALSLVLYSNFDDAETEHSASECVSLCERIMRDCRDNNIRNSTLSLLVYVYSDDELAIADEAKSVKYAEEAAGIWDSREILLEAAYFTKESAQKKERQRQMNIINLMDHLCMNIYYRQYDDPKDIIRACETALKLWETLIYDGNYLFFHCRLQKIYQLLAHSYAQLGESAKTIDALEMALFHAGKFESLPAGTSYYTSVFVSEVEETTEKSTRNYTQSDTDLVKRYMSLKIFDFVRGEEKFIRLLGDCT